jgi:hypothetical protein
MYGRYFAEPPALVRLRYPVHVDAPEEAEGRPEGLVNVSRNYHDEGRANYPLSISRDDHDAALNSLLRVGHRTSIGSLTRFLGQ